MIDKGGCFASDENEILNGRIFHLFIMNDTSSCIRFFDYLISFGL